VVIGTVASARDPKGADDASAAAVAPGHLLGEEDDPGG